jgi:hypothetical protein
MMTFATGSPAAGGFFVPDGVPGLQKMIAGVHFAKKRAI